MNDGMPTEYTLPMAFFPVPLGDVPIGKPFIMFNYDQEGAHIRVAAGQDWQTVLRFRPGNPKPLDDDGFHVPIVRLATGELFWMSKTKPCRLVC